MARKTVKANAKRRRVKPSARASASGARTRGAGASGAGVGTRTAASRAVAGFGLSRAENVAEIRRRLLVSRLQGEIGLVLVRESKLKTMLASCASLIFKRLDVAFVRIWTVDAGGKILELQASAGMYTHLDGPHSRIRVGEYKIGLIAKERVAHLTNSVVGDKRIHDQKWAKREKLVAFAGHPLLVDDELVGVLALFSRNELPQETLDVLAAVANAIALGINRKRGEEELRENEERLRGAFRQTYSFMVMLTPDGTITEMNRAVQDAIGLSPEQVVGTKFWDLWGRGLPAEASRLRSMVAKAAAGHIVRRECEYIGSDGAVRAADRTLSPVKDETGKVTMIVATGKDVTEQRVLREQLERKVLERTRELNEKNREIAMQANRLRELSTRLLQVQDEERRRIARELHDSAGQQLAALAMNFYVLRSGEGWLSETQLRALKESTELVTQLTEEIRTLSYLLHPPLLDVTGVSSALRWYVDGFSERSKIAVTLHVEKDFGRLPTEIETTLFRIVQESLTNVHRHSGSTTAVIRLQRMKDEVRLEVLDTGVGMPHKTGALGEDAKSGVGILGMSERVRQLGGSFVISAGKPGTRISAVFPLGLVGG